MKKRHFPLLFSFLFFIFLMAGCTRQWITFRLDGYRSLALLFALVSSPLKTSSAILPALWKWLVSCLCSAFWPPCIALPSCHPPSMSSHTRLSWTPLLMLPQSVMVIPGNNRQGSCKTCHPLCFENVFHPQRPFLDNEEGQTGAAHRKKPLEGKSVFLSHADPRLVFWASNLKMWRTWKTWEKKIKRMLNMFERYVYG